MTVLPTHFVFSFRFRCLCPHLSLKWIWTILCALSQFRLCSGSVKSTHRTQQGLEIPPPPPPWCFDGSLWIRSYHASCAKRQLEKVLHPMGKSPFFFCSHSIAWISHSHVTNHKCMISLSCPRRKVSGKLNPFSENIQNGHKVWPLPIHRWEGIRPKRGIANHKGPFPSPKFILGYGSGLKIGSEPPSPIWI